jgi:WhiB family transcriptional regulator, redox-sensing transcriptional regulator
MISIWLLPPDWHNEAVCGTVSDPDIFFPDHGNTVNTPGARLAKEYCSVCPVRIECLDDAQPHGIWGGMTAGERHALRQQPIAYRQL